MTADPGSWPDAYREGVVEGLFVNEDGQLDVHSTISASSAAVALAHHSSPDRVVAELQSLLASASWSPAFDHTRDAVLDSMHTVTPTLPASARRAWAGIIDNLRIDEEL